MATTVVASNGTITIFLNDAIVAGDLITVKLANVTNPAAGTITDFTVATNGEDGVPSYAAPYVIGANGSPGVVVTVNPSGTTQTAQYTISNVYASAALAGGSSTIGIDGPAGTVFPNNQAFYVLQDSTTPAGSGSVSAAVTGGGTNDVVITVPNSINSGGRVHDHDPGRLQPEHGVEHRLHHPCRKRDRAGPCWDYNDYDNSPAHDNHDGTPETRRQGAHDHSNGCQESGGAQTQLQRGNLRGQDHPH